jgi:hypothetical protein
MVKAATVERLTKESACCAPVRSQRDVARIAPDALIGHVRKLLGAA